VKGESQQLTAPGETGVLDVPGIIRQELGLFCREVNVRDAMELVFLVSCGVDALAVGTEADGSIGHRFLVDGSKRSLLAGSQINQEEVRFVDGDLVYSEQSLVVGRPIGDLPAAALVLY